MVAMNTKKTPQESASEQPATKRTPPKNPTTTTLVKPSKPAPALTKKPSKHGLPQKVRKGKPTFQLVDEDDEAQQESVPQEEGDDPDLELAKKMSLVVHQEKGEGKGDDSLDPAFLPQGRALVGGVTIRDPVSETTPKLPEFILVRRDQAPHDSTTGPSSQPEEDTSEKVIHESSSTSDSERTKSETEAAAPKGDKDQGQTRSDPEKAHEALAGPDPEPMQEDQTGSDSGNVHVCLAGPNPEHMDDEFLATAYPKVHENLKLVTDERVIDDKPESHSGSMSSMKNLDDTFNFGDQFLYDKPTEDDQEKSKVREESESTIPDPNQTVTSTPPVIAPFTDVSSSKPSLLVTPPPINTEATTITTSLPEITPFIALQLRSVKNQESEKSPKEIIRAKKEQGEEKQDSTYSIRSTDKVDLEEFDLKSALFRHMNKIKSANRNTANYRLYHALMEALITDEDAMDKEVADKVKDHKRKHDSDDDEDDDDDEGPSAGSNQGRSTKRRRSDSAASGSAKPPPKDDDQSSKKPRESEASASKQHPTLTSTGWQITDTREAGVDSSMHRSDPESEHSEQSSDDISMQDEGNDSDMEDTDNAHIPKVSTTTWFKPIPESERPATPEPEWTIPPNDFPEPEHNWANAYATTYKVPEENKLQRKTYDIGSFIKWFCRRTGKKKLCKADLEGPAFNLVKAFHKNNVFLQYQMDECHKLLTNKVDLSNPEGHQIPQNINEPLPLGGPPGQVTIQPQFFFNKDLDYLLTDPAPSFMTPGYSVQDSWFTFNQLIQLDQDEERSTTGNGRGSERAVLSRERLRARELKWVSSVHSEGGPVLHEMTSDQICSDLTPNRQETSVDNISSDLVSNKQKASDYDISGPCAPKEKFLYLKNITIQHTVKLRKTTIIKHRMHRFKNDDLSILFCTTGNKKLVSLTSRNNDIPMSHSFQPQSPMKLPDGPEDHPIRTVHEIQPTSSNKMTSCRNPDMWYDNFQQFDRLNVWNIVDQTIWQEVNKLKQEVFDYEEIISPVAPLGSSS
ncbi:hypothetical protein Tco_0682922, partial [Tanacetum coccineum]